MLISGWVEEEREETPQSGREGARQRGREGALELARQTIEFAGGFE